ncbi:mitochondrial 2-oxodicarboxylate carrier [Leptonychotes weddellii]|uniref:Mitochondrial 2-oxodicarboxylate carrier n=1 Tax=Leptonychotes weddellii TaxID=9713 RepID=A0A2U3Z313_LEPWE|nr:mitochondrial 2-oxodicarboxylate carrier [Leptonychotes weddellii]
MKLQLHQVMSHQVTSYCFVKEGYHRDNPAGGFLSPLIVTIICGLSVLIESDTGAPLLAHLDTNIDTGYISPACWFSKAQGECTKPVNKGYCSGRCPQAAEVLFGFYKGILPPILAETPKRAVKFFTFEQYKKLLGYVSLSPALTFAIAGLGSGLTEAIVVNPFEVVKVGLQANRNKFTEDPTLEFLRKFGIGLLSGTIASVINIPFDVAKSRIQGPQPVPGEIKYRTCFKTMATVYQEEGILALYKGLLPKVMRLGPGGAVMLLVYEYTYSWLQENW